jgi:hypothetical protein
MKMTAEKAKELAKQAREWLVSEEGRQLLQAAAVRAEETISQLENDQKVEPHKLSEPFTV